jgi:hypothetical protein
MKIVWTILLSLVAIVASLVLVLSTICTFRGDMFGHKDPVYLICDIGALAVVIAAMWAIGKLNKKA